MRILNLIQCANLGGMEQASLRLMRALQQRGHEIQLISLNPIGALGPLLEEAKIPARGLNYASARKIDAFRALSHALSRETADAMIMTGHNFAASLALGDFCRGRRLMAMHFHHEGVMPRWRWRLLYRVARAQFQAITFPSDYVRNEAEAIAPFIRPIARTVRNPLEIPPPASPALREAFRAELGVPPTAPLFGNAGWLIKRKRFDVFLQTAQAILATRPDARFVIAGDGEERTALEKQARALGVSGAITWLGWLRDLDPFYAGIDVLLFHSDWDAFPTTPVEAMSRGIPVVASLAHGGLSEVLDARTGWLFDRHAIDELAAAAFEALSPEGEIRATHARARIRDMSEPGAIATDIERDLAGKAHAKLG